MTVTGWWPLASGAHGPRRRPPGPRTVALTSCGDQVEHQVDVEVLDGAAGEPGGPVVTCCGDRVLPAPLSAPPGRPCPRCVARVRAEAVGVPPRPPGAVASRSWLTFGLVGVQRPPSED